jgi:hypothetical protein
MYESDEDELFAFLIIILRFLHPCERLVTSMLEAAEPSVPATKSAPFCLAQPTTPPDTISISPVFPIPSRAGVLAAEA